MSEDTTQQLLLTRVDRLISIVEDTNRLVMQFDERMKNLEANQSALTAQFETLEAKVDQRLKETRPIWENVLSRLDVIESRLDALDARTARIEKDLAEFRAETASGFRGFDRKIGVLSKTLVDMTADIRELQDRTEKLESHPV